MTNADKMYYKIRFDRWGTGYDGWYTEDNLIFSTASAMKNKILRIDSRKEFNNLKIYQAPGILKSLNAYEYLGRDDRACLLEPGNLCAYVFIHIYIYICTL
jgi:hypothetical protein